jgi:hypothetical protein
VSRPKNWTSRLKTTRRRTSKRFGRCSVLHRLVTRLIHHLSRYLRMSRGRALYLTPHCILSLHPRQLRRQTPAHLSNSHGLPRPSADRMHRTALCRPTPLQSDPIIQGPFAVYRMGWVDSGAWRGDPIPTSIQLENLRRRSNQLARTIANTTTTSRTRPRCKNGKSRFQASPDP